MTSQTEPIEVTVRGVKAEIVSSLSFAGGHYVVRYNPLVWLGEGGWTDDYDARRIFPSPADAIAFVAKHNAELDNTRLIALAAENQPPQEWLEGEEEKLFERAASQPPQGEPTSCVQSQPSWDSDPAVQIGSLSFDAPSKPPQSEPQPRERPVCSVCNWTNCDCLNLGDPNGEHKWMCHGCIKRSLDGLTRQLAESQRISEARKSFALKTAEERTKLRRQLAEANTENARLLSGSEMLAAISAIQAKELKAKDDEIERLKAIFAKFETVGCSCGSSDCDPGDCCGCRGIMVGILRDQVEELEQQLTAAQAATAGEAAATAIVGRPDKPFHRPECNCRECEAWKIYHAAQEQPAAPSPPRPVGWGRLKVKADSFDALWQVCIECGMEVHPPGIDEDGERVPATLGEGRYEVYRKVSGVRSGEGPYVLSADAIAIIPPDQEGA